LEKNEAGSERRRDKGSMKVEGFIFSPRPFYGTLTERKGTIESLRSSRTPKAIKRLIVPGMISTHTHTIQTHARNTAENMELLDWLSKVIWPFEAKLNAKTAYASAHTGMRECLSHGITSILDMGTTRHTEKVFEAARDLGIRAWIGKALMDRGPRSLVEKNPLPEVYDLLDRWHGAQDDLLHVSLCPRFVLSCSDDLLKKVGQLSRELEIINHTHASENKRECEWIEKNLKASNISYLARQGNLSPWTVIAHGVHLSEKEVRLLKTSGAHLSHCPTSNLKLASGIADIKRLSHLNLSLGVDGAACNNLLDPFFEMRLAHLLSRGLHGLQGRSARDVFLMATLYGAKALHSEKRIGSLEVGKEADYIVMRVPELVQFNPLYPYESLIHSMTSANIEKVFVRGRCVFSCHLN
jgi:cytosine/adenosine deaminase-related metal-dependent hydrolase